MDERIPMRYTVALQGFSAFERDAMASSFRLGLQRAPSYQQGASVAASDFIIANGDSTTEVSALREANRLQDTIFVGAQPPAGAAVCLARPIDPTRLLRELDLLLEQRLAQHDEPPLTDWDTPPPDTMPDLSIGARDVLVLDDSRIALKFLQTRLQGLGYRVHATQDITHAMTLLDHQPFALVFLDIDLGDGPLDGLGLCQRLKQRSSHPGDLAPKVVIVTGSTSAVDRVRGALAGCDAYLTKPLMETEFVDALQRLDPT